VEAERTIGSFLATRGHGNGACRDRGVPRRLRTSSFPSLSPLSPLPSSCLRCPSSSLKGFNVVNSLLIWSLSIALIWSLSIALRVHSRGSTLRTPASSGPSPSPFKFSSTLQYPRFLCPSVALRVHLRGSTSRTPFSSGPSPSPFFGSTL